ncbi:hypothetical protein HK102_012458 [Quaeritorhiza haematococci]|nr:hypothetical protein HK102_012458 [Quaeritorhiza haematococci]
MIIERKKFTEEESRKVMFQLLRALKYLHDRGISHRENILLVSKDANDLRIKISDFGLAKLVGEESFMRTICGTPNYVAPEVLSQQRLKGYTKAVDMWSTGVILYICLCGYPPFSEELAPPSMMEQIKKGKYQFQSPWWDGISKEAKDLIQRLLTVDPQKRYTADQALNHPWMKLTSPAQDPALAPLLDPAFAPAHTFTRGDTILSPGKAARPAAKTYKETPNKKRKTPEFVKTAATTEDTFVDETTPLVGTPKSVDSPQTISTVTTTVDGDVGDAETTNPARKRRKKGE